MLDDKIHSKPFTQNRAASPDVCFLFNIDVEFCDMNYVLNFKI